MLIYFWRLSKFAEHPFTRTNDRALLPSVASSQRSLAVARQQPSPVIYACASPTDMSFSNEFVWTTHNGYVLWCFTLFVERNNTTTKLNHMLYVSNRFILTGHSLMGISNRQASQTPCPSMLRSWFRRAAHLSFGRGDDTVGNLHRAQISQLELLELKFLNSSCSSLLSYWNWANSSLSSNSRHRHLSQQYAQSTY